MYHYTYIIKDKKSKMKYIGVRSSKCKPLEDTSYWGSSKYLPKDIQSTHKKRILRIFSSREAAVAHEIELHNKYNVVSSKEFYNKAKQTSTGFDTQGTTLPPFSKEHRKKLSDSIKKYTSTLDYVNPRKGIKLSKETKQKLSESLKNSRNKKSSSEASPRFKPWFIEDVKTKNLEVFYDLTKQEYASRFNISIATLKAAVLRSKGTHPIKKGLFKGKILGNLEDYKKAQNIRQKRAWFITYPDYSLPFYFKTKKQYALDNNLKPQQVADAINLSKGVNVIKKGPFKGLILGKIE